MSPNIRVDQDVYGLLQRNAQPFTDTPNSVLRRLLGLPERGDEGVTNVTPVKAPQARRGRVDPKQRTKRLRRKPERRRATAGMLLTEEAYVRPLIESLADLGGRAAARDVIESLGKKLAHQLTAADKETISSGAVRWQNRAQFVRLRLVEQGLLSKHSPRGVWELTELGQERVAASA